MALRPSISRRLAQGVFAWAGYRVVSGWVEGRVVRDCKEKRRSESIARGAFVAHVQFEHPLWPFANVTRVVYVRPRCRARTTTYTLPRRAGRGGAVQAAAEVIEEKEVLPERAGSRPRRTPRPMRPHQPPQLPAVDALCRRARRPCSH